MFDSKGPEILPPARIAFLGLGMMGLPMAAQLIKAGYAVSGFDPVEASRAALADLEGTACASAAEAIGGALNNYVSAAGLTAACEALRVGRAFGLDPAMMTDVLNASTGRNNSTEVKLKPFVISQTYGSGFSMALMAKDLRTADDLARHLDVPAPLSHAVTSLWSEADQALGAGTDHTAIDRFLRDDAAEPKD